MLARPLLLTARKCAVQMGDLPPPPPLASRGGGDYGGDYSHQELPGPPGGLPPPPPGVRETPEVRPRLSSPTLPVGGAAAAASKLRV